MKKYKNFSNYNIGMLYFIRGHNSDFFLPPPNQNNTNNCTKSCVVVLEDLSQLISLSRTCDVTNDVFCFVNGFDSSLKIKHFKIFKIKKALKAIKAKKVWFFVDPVANNKHYFKCGIIKLFNNIFTYEPTDFEKYGYPLIDFPVFDVRTSGIDLNVKVIYKLGIVQNGQGAKDLNRIHNTYELLKKLDDAHVSYIHKTGWLDSIPVEKRNEQIQYLVNHTNFKSCEKGYVSGFSPFLTDFSNFMSVSYCYAYINSGLYKYLGSNIFFAFLLNKKIITPNPYIKSHPCYDSRWVKVVEDFKDIDKETIDWINDDTIVPDYKNKESVLIDAFADKLLKMLNNK